LIANCHAVRSNQGIQFPLARAYAQLRAAELMVEKAAQLFDAGRSCGAEANMTKLLAAAEACVQTHGGFGFAAEYDITSANSARPGSTRWHRSRPISS
jgi:alkylation response protein AidB-like acyl-CoA dehydrogenase